MDWDRSRKSLIWKGVKTYLFGRRYWFLFVGTILASFVLYDYVFGFQDVFVGYFLSCLFFLLVFCLLLDSLSVYRSYRAKLLDKDFPSQTPTEAFLNQSVQDLTEKNQALLDDARMRQGEFLDYFTLWAHQMKTPIAASRLILQDMTGQEQEDLQAELFRIEHYADSVMQYLRLETFHQDVQLEQENVGDLVRQVIRKYALFFIKEQIQLELGDLDKVFVTDKKWFVVLLEQILSNAVKYSSKGKITIQLVGEELWLADTGIGIQESDLSRVFERGFSGYNGRINQQSSGLGLYLVKRISDNLGHSVSLDSKVGQGTTVKLSLAQRKELGE